MSEAMKSTRLGTLLLALALLFLSSSAVAGENMCVGAVQHLRAEAGYLEAYKTVRGDYPASLDELRDFLDSAGKVDPWGNSLHYEKLPEGFALGSSGPDGAWGTDDDLRYSLELLNNPGFCFPGSSGQELEDEDDGLSSRTRWLIALLVGVGLLAGGVLVSESGGYRRDS